MPVSRSGPTFQACWTASVRVSHLVKYLEAEDTDMLSDLGKRQRFSGPNVPTWLFLGEWCFSLPVIWAQPLSTLVFSHYFHLYRSSESC